MKIVNVIGGLGNQMFQYAFALSLKKRYPNEDVLLDIHHFKHYPLHNGYELENVFPFLSLKTASWKQIIQLSWYVPHYKLSRLVRKMMPARKTEYIQKEDFAFEPEVYTLRGNIYYEGYWQGYKYYEGIRDVLKKDFRFPYPDDYNKKMVDEINWNDAIGIHVRRGDYVGNGGFGNICTEEYYQKAISLLRKDEKTRFFVFSNDINWCREHIEPLLPNVTYVEGNQGRMSCWDMYLMSKCRQLIIANSSFSWWAAYLNDKSERVIAPRLWVRTSQRVEIQMPEWLLI